MTTNTVSSLHGMLPSGRAPRRFEADRVCIEPGCRTKLSIYNRNEACFQHSPLRYPRTRGRTATN